jgi:DHA1 family bicyclomycin/chloramphenicol resistance-like MFS transporter
MSATSIRTILPLAVLTTFFATLGLRGPPAFSDALALPSAQMGRASALMVLLLPGAGVALTQATALFLMHWQLGAVVTAMALSA